MIDKIEAGKTYRLIDKEGYIEKCEANLIFYMGLFQEDCIKIERVGEKGEGLVSNDLPGVTDVAISRCEYKYFELVEDKPKPIRPEDEVTITTTYGDLARAYALLGRAKGKTFGDESLFSKIAVLIDPYGEKYDNFNFPDDAYMLDYYSYQQKWLDTLFPQKTEQEVAIEEKQKEIDRLEKEIKELRNKQLQY